MKIFFSGGESKDALECFTRCEPPHILLSYFYLRKKEHLLSQIKSKIFLDSGVYSLRSHPEKLNKNYIDHYVKKYRDFCLKHLDKIEICAEMDLDGDFPIEQIEKWREVLLKAKLPVCVVWHPERGKPYWKKQCKEYEYNGLAADILGEVTDIELKKFFKSAKAYKTKVHGFAMTKAKYMAKFPFYSCDSTSWLHGRQFGKTYIFKNGKWTILGTDDKYRRKKYVRIALKMGFNRKKFLSDDENTIKDFNLMNWLKFESYLDKKQEGRKYWEGKKQAVIKKEKPIENKDTFQNLQKEIKEVAENKAVIPIEKPIENLPAVPEKNDDIERVEASNIMAQAKKRSVADIEKIRQGMKGNLNALKHGMYSNAIPLMCEDCFLGGQKEEFEEYYNYLIDTNPKKKLDPEIEMPACNFWLPGNVCAFSKISDKYKIRNQRDLVQFLEELVSAQEQRVNFGLLYEKIEGGGSIDKDVSTELQRLSDMAKDLLRIKTPNPTARGNIGDTKVTIEGDGESILAKLFTPDNNATDAEYEVIDEDKAEESKDGQAKDAKLEESKPKVEQKKVSTKSVKGKPKK